MRVFFTPARLYLGGVLTYIEPDAVEAQTTAGVTIQGGLAVSTAGNERFVDSLDSLYTHHVRYRLKIDSTVAGTAVSRYKSFRHVTTAIGTAPGPPTIGMPSIGEEQATFPHTPPTDASYTSTTIFMIPVLGGTTVEGSGSGSLITVSGLTPGVLYSSHGVACGTGGTCSDPGNVILATTLPASDIEMPAYLKWWVNDEDEMHEHGPEAFDPSVTGDRRFHDLGRGRTWSMMIECHEPVFFGVRGLGGVMTVPRGQPGGLRNDVGT